MSDWEEVRKLAADFQQLQATAGANKLSERNCIELVTRLIQMGQIDVVYTVDGKEYVTPQHLEKEIKNELLVHRGRINVVDLQQLLNIDLSHIEAKIADLLKHDHSLTLLQGELIGRSYIDALCEEINDTLQEAGQMMVADLSKNFALPNSFLIQHIEAALGKTIQGHLDKADSGIIYTESYVSRYHARIRGLFGAITRPTPIGPIIVQGHFQDKLFQSVLQELISSGQLAGSLRGRMDKAVYVPNIYTRMQNAWIDSFLASSGYLEYDALTRMGIDDPKDYIEKRYASDGKVTLLVTCAVGEAVVTQVEAAVEEAQSSGSWVDIMFSLPTPCTDEDANMLLCMKYQKSTALRIFKSTIVTKQFLNTCLDVFGALIQEKADKAAQIHSKIVASMSDGKENISSGGQKATQRRSGGRKGGKFKGRDRHSDGGEDQWNLQFMSVAEISTVLSENYHDCGEELIGYLAEELMGVLQARFQEAAKAALAAQAQVVSMGQQKKKHANLQEKIQGLWNNSKLFGKALAYFKDANDVSQLSKYLLRTLCSELTNMIVLNLAEDSGLPIPENDLSNTVRVQLISKMPVHVKKYLTALNETLSGKEIVTFFEAFEELCSQTYCGILLKKVDRKKERQLLYSHQQSLLASLKDEDDPAMALHLTSVLLFQQHTGCCIHVPGKLVPIVINFLEAQMSSEHFSIITKFQKLVILQWKAKSKPSTDEDQGAEAIGSSAGEVAQCHADSTSDDQLSAKDIDEQLRGLIGQLKGLVIKPQISDN